MRCPLVGCGTLNRMTLSIMQSFSVDHIMPGQLINDLGADRFHANQLRVLHERNAVYRPAARSNAGWRGLIFSSLIDNHRYLKNFMQLMKRILKWIVRVVFVLLLLAFLFMFVAYWRSTNDCDRYNTPPANPMKAIVYCDYGVANL